MLFHILSFKGHCFIFKIFFFVLYLIGPKKSNLHILGTLEKMIIHIWTCIHITYLYSMVSVASSILVQKCKDRRSKLGHCGHHSMYTKGYFVMLLADLKWFGNSQSGDLILPQVQKIECNLSPAEFCGQLFQTSSQL